jgi:ribosome-binding factor A
MSRGEKGNRPLRIAAEIRRDLPDILRKHVDLPSDLMVSITGVEVSPDLSQARIYFSVLGARENKAAAELEHLLNGKRGVVRTEIARRLVMRQHPELKFIYDETPARAARIETLLNQIQNESRAPEGGKDE